MTLVCTASGWHCRRRYPCAARRARQGLTIPTTLCQTHCKSHGSEALRPSEPCCGAGEQTDGQGAANPAAACVRVPLGAATGHPRGALKQSQTPGFAAAQARDAATPRREAWSCRRRWGHRSLAPSSGLPRSMRAQTTGLANTTIPACGPNIACCETSRAPAAARRVAASSWPAPPAMRRGSGWGWQCERAASRLSEHPPLKPSRSQQQEHTRPRPRRCCPRGRREAHVIAAADLVHRTRIAASHACSARGMQWHVPLLLLWGAGEKSLHRTLESHRHTAPSASTATLSALRALASTGLRHGVRRAAADSACTSLARAEKMHSSAA
jgi:hypothetical protein